MEKLREISMRIWHLDITSTLGHDYLIINLQVSVKSHIKTTYKVLSQHTQKKKIAVNHPINMLTFCFYYNKIMTMFFSSRGNMNLFLSEKKFWNDIHAKCKHATHPPRTPSTHTYTFWKKWVLYLKGRSLERKGEEYIYIYPERERLRYKGMWRQRWWE